MSIDTDQPYPEPIEETKQDAAPRAPADPPTNRPVVDRPTGRTALRELERIQFTALEQATLRDE